jgi:hypothetical protein
VSGESSGLLLFCLGLGVVAWGTLRYGRRLTLADVIGDALIAAGNILAGNWVVGVAMAAWTAWMAWGLWRRRKRRKRAARELGYKARALLAELCRKARESARPRPVLRPVPGGAR